MRQHAPDEYFHIFSRGVRKQPIFECVSDYLRFLFLILAFQGEFRILNTTRELKNRIKDKFINIDIDLESEIVKDRLVELVSFCLMPNHFHLLIKENKEGGISKYMQRVLTAYAKYYNIRHDKSGYVFQGKFKDVLILDDRQIMHLSAYIHKNPSELGWKGREDKYLWSSYQDYVVKNRFGKLLSPGIILERYDGDCMEYKRFVSTSPAKEGDFMGVL